MNCIYEKPLENYEHKLYPVQCFQNREANQYSAAHWHQNIEIIYVKKGGYCVIVNGLSYNLQQGELIYILPGQIHTTIAPDTTDPIQTYVLKYNADLLLSVAGKYIEQNILSMFLSCHMLPSIYFMQEQIQTVFLEDRLESIMKELTVQQDGYLLAIRNSICDIVLHLYRNFHKTKNRLTEGSYTQSHLDDFYRVFQFIEENYNQKIALEDILPICHLSYSNFAYKFKSITGQSFIGYINRHRIRKAQELLVSSSRSINEIAAECGFDDVCYFNRLFRKYSGTSPREFRMH